jgi:hypothetical protein
MVASHLWEGDSYIMNDTRLCPACGIVSDVKHFAIKSSRGEKLRRQKKCNSCRNKTRYTTHVGWLRRILIYTKNPRLSSGRLLDNELDIEFLKLLWEKQNGRCGITGLKMTHNANDSCAASIDRIDSKIGYLRKNIILTCRWANVGRGLTSIEQFQAILKRLEL